MKPVMAISIAAAMALWACGKKSDQAEAPRMVPEAAEVPKAATPEHVAPISDSFQAGIGKVYEGYLRIESALAHDDFKGAKSAFESMHAVLHVLPKGELDSSQKAGWERLDASFMEVLHPMASSKDIDGMRNHLAKFTPLVVEALEGFGARTRSKAYLFHCPMAKENTGADWLQSEAKLLNPYYGAKMPSCGNLVREINLL